ncbi:hypothetical protein FHS68_001851 [Dyadobacter arcticus]|uniref:Uncharacterized protein n=1 Tax=Dyadobacter arcticus TaxID=1078754 RepID=A0ABX0UI45_9BACT|nr:hypothetical protein [Dyadobacter arcticus]
MLENTSTQIAGLLGPILMVISTSEYFNFKIWRTVDPTVVVLNGLVIFIGGLAIIRYHNFWIANWTLIITISGWLIFTLGTYRMLFPSQKQLQQNKTTNLILFVIFFVGCFLTSRVYLGL